MAYSITQELGYYARVKTKFSIRKCCLRSSGAAILILVWNLIISFLLSFFDPSLYLSLFNSVTEECSSSGYWTFTDSIIGALYSITGILFLFYPVCGCLADIRWGRNKTVVYSLCFVLGGIVSLTVLVLCIMFPTLLNLYSTNNIIGYIIICASLSLLFGISVCIGAMLLLCSLVAFNANVIQLGTDQLRDAPTDESRLYINWYLWTTFVGSLVLRSSSSIWYVTPSSYFGISSGSKAYLQYPLTYTVWILVILLTPFLLGITLCVYKCKQNLLFIQSGSRNPYKLVFKILRFAKEHTYPIRRSAFTYCEDELPSRLDLAKEKYGGPFTTEEVENVKAFLGILHILLTLGPTFLVDVAVNGLIPVLAINSYSYSYHLSMSDKFNNTVYINGTVYINNVNTVYINISSFMTPMIIVLIIPVFLCLLRPFIHDYIPGMLKRIGLGMILLFVSGMCTLAMGLTGHGSTNCTESVNAYIKIQPNYLLIQCSFNAIGYMLLYIASYEFICAQSPHSMKGFLIGTFFAIKGIFQLIGVLVLYIPITFFCSPPSNSRFPLCGFVYYSINIVIALVGIVAFIYVARRYQYRKRDEPDNIYRYAEEYYAKAEDEPNYDYDDYDNLNCETIMKENTQ